MATMSESKERLIKTLILEAEETASWTGRDHFSDRTLAAMAAVPRELFMPSDLEVVAYVNRPQSIGFGQTISQPYIVALMSDLLDAGPGERILEIGTGSGYQAAVLAEMGAEVFSLETVAELAETAKKNLARAKTETVHVRHGDGFRGWPEEAPFDGVIVTAAPEHIPKTLLEQLKCGGRIVIPIGPRSGPQMLHLGIKRDDGSLDDRSLLPVAFVPMVRGQ